MAIPEVIKELLENGVHFGHLAKHWNPKMKKFIFGKKKNIYIIDLEKTVVKLDEAKEFVKSIAKKDGKILFVTTKKQLRDVVKELAISCKMPYVSIRWVGGFLTNFPTVYTRMKKYNNLLAQRISGAFEKMPRKEVVRLNRELTRMEKNYSGVSTITEIPAAIFLVDPKKEMACVHEANIVSVPIIALVDTDSDPEVIDYPIPGNDDAIKSVKYVTTAIAEAIKEGLKQAEELRMQSAEEAKAKAEEGVTKDDEVTVEIDTEDIVGKAKETKSVPRKRPARKEDKMVDTIKRLRQLTSLGMNDCKKALDEAKGDFDKALELCKQRGISVARGKGDRKTSQGLIDSYIHFGGNLGALVEVNCETDFVARTDVFKNFIKDVAMQVAATNPVYVKREDIPQAEAEKIKNLDEYAKDCCLLEQVYIKDNAITMGDYLKQVVSQTGENVVVKRFTRFSLEG